MKVLGVVGWSGSGKTTLIEGLIPRLRAEGLSVSTVKHTHHGFDIDRPGKDSFRHRQAGAHEVLVSSDDRWALLHEASDGRADLDSLLARLDPVDLVLVEGFKSHPFAKLEVFRADLDRVPLWRDQADVVAVASDVRPAGCDRVWLDLNDIATVAVWVCHFTHSTPGRP